MAVALTTLLDVETEVESVFVAYLTTTLGLPAIGSDTDSDVVTPRVEVTATVVEQPPHQLTIASGTYAGKRLHDFFRIRVQFKLIYSPAWGQAQDALRGQMRKALADYPGIAAGLAANNYLFLAPDTYRPVWGARTINEELKEETITQSVEAIFALNPAQLNTAT